MPTIKKRHLYVFLAVVGVAAVLIPIGYYGGIFQEVRTCYETVLLDFENRRFFDDEYVEYCRDLVRNNFVAVGIAGDIRKEVKAEIEEEERRIEAERAERRAERAEEEADKRDFDEWLASQERAEQERKRNEEKKERAEQERIKRESRLSDLDAELERIEPAYLKMKSEWNIVDGAFQDAKSQVDRAERRLAVIEDELAETYAGSEFAVWEKGLLIGFHCRDYLSHADRKLAAFCAAVEDFRSMDGKSGSLEAVHAVRKQIVGLPNPIEVLNCSIKKGNDLWDCQKKATDLAAHNASWLKKWDEYAAIKDNMDGLESTYLEQKSIRDKVQPEWDEVSTEYGRISSAMCDLDASRCE